MSLTKASYSMITGASANVIDFGADPTGAADSTSAIQSALDSFSCVTLPSGTYKISSPLQFNTSNFLMGQGTSSILNATHNGAIIAGKSVTPSSGTNVRRYRGGGSNFTINGPGAGANTSSIGLDMRGCSQFKWFDIWITNVYTGVKQGDNYSTYYNEFYACDIQYVYYGYDNSTLGNENLVVGGRVNDCSIGTRDSDCSHNVYVKLAIELFTTGHKTISPAAVSIQYITSRLESGTTGVLIDATAQDTTIISPQYQTVTTAVTNNGSTTIRFDNLGVKTRYGSLVTCAAIQTINQAIGPISATTSLQISFSLTAIPGTSIVPGDSVSITLPSTWPSTLVASAPLVSGTNAVAMNVYNSSASPVSLSAANYVITIFKMT